MEPYKVGILNEHEPWQRELCEKLNKAGISVLRIPIQGDSFDVSWNDFSDVNLVINRASPSAMKRGHRAAVLYTLQLLNHFEQLGIPVINGSRAYMLEISKARQYQLLKGLGLPFPHTIIVNSAICAVQASERLGPPLLLKPNIGGSGAGVKPFENRVPTSAEAQEVLDSSADGVALVQEFKKPDQKTTYRVQMIGTDHLYSLKAIGDGLNRCPNVRDCEPSETEAEPECEPPEMKFEAHDEDPEVLEQVKLIVKEGGFDTCGVEYLISEGRYYFFDINALSNIVRDAAEVFKEYKNFVDPTDRFVCFVKERLSQCGRT